MTNEFIAIELVKAWCMQPTTASRCFTFQQVLDNYRDAVTELDRFHGVEDDTDYGVPCEELSKEGTDDAVEDYEKKFRSLKYNFQGLDYDEIENALTKGV